MSALRRLERLAEEDDDTEVCSIDFAAALERPDPADRQQLIWILFRLWTGFDPDRPN